MILTAVTLTILAISAALVLGNLRMIAQDTYTAVSHAAQSARASGALAPRVSFLLLWVMIFALSYM